MNFILYCMIYGKISQRGQVVIPKKIREEKNIQPGDTVKFIIKGEDLVIEKLESSKNVSLTTILKKIKFKDNIVSELRDEWE